MIASLRASGHGCYLASNQEAYRATYMSETLRYRTVFDGEFYSCTIGYVKPAPAYFRAILDATALRAEETLFIDDLATNVEAARAMGLRASVFAPAADERWQDHLRRLLAENGVILEHVAPE
jgi:putative hydrolase of the HAD superfamily